MCSVKNPVRALSLCLLIYSIPAPAPAQANKARQLLDEAIDLAHQESGAVARSIELATIAAIIVKVDSTRAESLVGEIAQLSDEARDPVTKGVILANAAGVSLQIDLAEALPVVDRAVELLTRSSRPLESFEAIGFIRITEHLARENPSAALRIVHLFPSSIRLVPAVAAATTIATQSTPEKGIQFLEDALGRGTTLDIGAAQKASWKLTDLAALPVAERAKSRRDIDAILNLTRALSNEAYNIQYKYSLLVVVADLLAPLDRNVAIELFDESASLARTISDGSAARLAGVAESLWKLDPSKGNDLMTEAVTVARGIANPYERCGSLGSIVRNLLATDSKAARVLLEETVRLARSPGVTREPLLQRAIVLANLADIYIDFGEVLQLDEPAEVAVSLASSIDNGARLELLANGEVTDRGYMLHSLAVHGEMVVVGNSGIPLTLGDSLFKAGEVRVLRIEGDRLAEQARLAGSFRYSFFGKALSFWEDALVVGAPNYGGRGSASGQMARLSGEGRLYVFRRSDQDRIWLETGQIEPPSRRNIGQFGKAVDISGQSAIVGAPRTNDPDAGLAGLGTGAAFIFSLDGPVWRLNEQLKNPSPAGFAEFGCSVGIAEDNAVISSAQSDTLGRVFTYHHTQNKWRRTGNLWPPGGADYSGYYCPPVALRGDNMLVGGYGESHLFEWDGSSWRTSDALIHPGSERAAQVHLGDDIAVIAAGATVYLYGRSDRGWRILSEAKLDGHVQELDVDADIVAVGHLRYVSLFKVVR